MKESEPLPDGDSGEKIQKVGTDMHRYNQGGGGWWPFNMGNLGNDSSLWVYHTAYHCIDLCTEMFEAFAMHKLGTVMLSCYDNRDPCNSWKNHRT